MPSASAILYSPFDELDDHFTNAHRFGRPRRPELLLLRPNQRALLLLCPLLPPSPTHDHVQLAKSKRARLPAEAWQRVLGFAMQAEDDGDSSACSKVRLLLVCKSFQNLATPLLYTSVRIFTLRGLGLFANTLTSADAKWDSIRRIPHSTPGRWVQRVSMANLEPCSSLALDSILVRALPVMPFLSTLELDGRYVMSWRVGALIPKHLKVLKGVRVREEIKFEGVKSNADDAITGLVRSLTQLEELSIQGPGLDIDEDEDQVFEDEEPEHPHSASSEVVLPHLHHLTLLDCPYTPVYRMLTRAALPALIDLTITTTPTIQITPPEPAPGLAPPPDPEVPLFVQPTPTTTFLARHGSSLRRLALLPTQQWPPAPAPAPDDLLLQCPEIRELILGMPLPARLMPAEPTKPRGSAPVSPLLARLALAPEPGTPFSAPPSRALSPSTPSYALTTLKIPIPTHAFLSCLTSSPALRNLREVKFSSARWLRKGMGRTAQGTGVNGEMMRWRRELGRAGIKVLDSDGREEIEEVQIAARSPMRMSKVGAKVKETTQRGAKESRQNMVGDEVHGRRWSG